MAGEAKPCARCGKRFFRPKKLSQGQWDARRFCSKRCSAMRRRVSDQEILDLYTKENSSTEIARLVGISAVHVLRILRSHDATRSASEAHKIAANKPEAKEKMARRPRRPCPEHVKDALRGIVGPDHHSWRSGLTANAQGYLYFTTSPANGAHSGKALHTVVAEWKFGRSVGPAEHVHHIDGNKMNNHPDNLEILSASEHSKIHSDDRQKGRRKWLDRSIA